MHPREFRQPRHHRIDAALARIGQRAAAEWCESRTEYHAGVDEVRISDDLLAQHRCAFVGQRENQAILEIRGRRGGRGGRLERLAITPLVETFAALASEFL